MSMEHLARLMLVICVVAAVLVLAVGAWPTKNAAANDRVELRAQLPERGGWSVDVLHTQVGEPLRILMVSDDVVHGFAVGQYEGQEIELYPGHWVTTTLRFDHPGTYTFYCTRWCGPNHWRMRGTIEVTGEGTAMPVSSPRYVELGIDIDAPHPAAAVPETVTTAALGAQWADSLPEYALEENTYWAYSPAELWARLREEPSLDRLSDLEVWHIVAWIWAQPTATTRRAEGQQIYVQECAACHGETGRGDGVMVRDLMPFSYEPDRFGHSSMRPPDLSDPAHTLGAAPALFEGRILRGGMGTGMPLYGSIYTPEEIEALVGYLYSFVFVDD